MLECNTFRTSNRAEHGGHVGDARAAEETLTQSARTVEINQSSNPFRNWSPSPIHRALMPNNACQLIGLYFLACLLTYLLTWSSVNELASQPGRQWTRHSLSKSWIGNSPYSSIQKGRHVPYLLLSSITAHILPVSSAKNAIRLFILASLCFAIQPLTATKPWNNRNPWIILKGESTKFRVWLNFYVTWPATTTTWGQSWNSSCRRE